MQINTMRGFSRYQQHLPAIQSPWSLGSVAGYKKNRTTEHCTRAEFLSNVQMVFQGLLTPANVSLLVDASASYSIDEISIACDI